MLKPRILLVLFAVAFLGIQVVSYMAGISRHEERLAKLERQVYQFEMGGTFVCLKMDPVLELGKEKGRFKAETMNIIIKVLVISAATVFVLRLMRAREKT